MEGTAPIVLGLIVSHALDEASLNKATFDAIVETAMQNLSAYLQGAPLCIQRGLVLHSNPPSWGARLAASWFLERSIVTIPYCETWRDLLADATDVIMVAHERDPLDRASNPILNVAGRLEKLWALSVVRESDKKVELAYYPTRGIAAPIAPREEETEDAGSGKRLRAAPSPMLELPQV
jgi:hypothetical protein